MSDEPFFRSSDNNVDFSNELPDGEGAIDPRAVLMAMKKYLAKGPPPLRPIHKPPTDDPRATFTRWLWETGPIIVPPAIYDDVMWVVRNEADGIYPEEGVIVPPEGSAPL